MRYIKTYYLALIALWAIRVLRAIFIGLSLSTVLIILVDQLLKDPFAPLLTLTYLFVFTAVVVGVVWKITDVYIWARAVTDAGRTLHWS